MACDNCGAEVTARGLRAHLGKPACNIAGHWRRLGEQRGLVPISLDQLALVRELEIEHEIAPSRLLSSKGQGKPSYKDSLWVPAWVANTYRQLPGMTADKRRALLSDPEAAKAAVVAAALRSKDDIEAERQHRIVRSIARARQARVAPLRLTR